MTVVKSIVRVWLAAGLMLGTLIIVFRYMQIKIPYLDEVSIQSSISRKVMRNLKLKFFFSILNNFNSNSHSNSNSCPVQ